MDSILYDYLVRELEVFVDMKSFFSSFAYQTLIFVTCFLCSLSLSINAKALNKSLNLTRTSLTENTKIAFNNKDNTRRQAIKHYNLAEEARRKGQNIEAIKYLNEALDSFNEAGDTRNYIVASLSLSQLYIKMGLLAKVEPILKHTYVLSQQENLTRHMAISKALLGSLNLRLNNLDIAVTLLKESLLIEKLPGTLIKLSEAYYEKVLALKKEIEVTVNTDEKLKLKNLRQDNLKKGKNQAVLGIQFSHSVREQILSKINLVTHYKNLISPEEFYQYRSELILLLEWQPDSSFKASRLIEIARLSNNSEKLHFLKKARNIAHDLGDNYNDSLAREEIGKHYLALKNYSEAKENTYEALLIAGNIPAPERLFYQYKTLGEIELLLERDRAALNAFDSALSNLQAKRGEFPLGPNLLFELQDDARPFLKEYISLLLSSNPTQSELKKATEILSVLKLSEFQAYFNDPCFDVVADTKNVTKSLPNTATIYSFILTKITYLILRLPDDSYKLIALDLNGEELRKKVREFRVAISKQLLFDYIPESIQFHQLLFGQIEKYLKANQIKNLAFIHDGILRNIPMEVLLNSQKQFLIERYKILYLTGLSGSLPKTERKRNNIFFGISEAREGLGALPNVVKEAESVKESLEAKVYLDSQFTYKNFENLLNNGNYSTIHIATHGKFSGTAKNSWLLSYDRQIILDALKNALLSTKSPPELLIFSACETAKGSQSATLGFAGVGLRARTKNVIGSLWPIPDLGTAELMELFYQELKNGTNLIDAKREAQLKMIQQKQDPASWAGLILIENKP